MKIQLPEGIPTEPPTAAEENALMAEIQAHRREEDIVSFAMRYICEAMPYLATVSKGRVMQDELLSISYDALLVAAKKYKPGGKLNFFRFAKIYLRSRMNKWWASQDVVRKSSKFRDDDAPETETFITDGAIRLNDWTRPAYDEIDLKERWEIVKPMLKRLTPRERMVLELIYIGGYSFAQVGKLVVPQVTRQAIGILHTRAMKRLHFALSEIQRTIIV